MTASETFGSSPQLSAFLVFIVEAALRGKAERLKGYTIGVEVLRRDTSFDPQIDPIVRVEATRLRRAIERYYAGPGIDDAIMIELPRGGYVPRIGWRAASSGAAPVEEPEPAVFAPGNGMPTLRVAPFVVVGTPGTRVIIAETLSGKLAEAFALFDIINITVAAPNSRNGVAHRSDYRLDGTVEYRGESVDVRFRLIDEADGTVIWSRSFENLTDREGGGETESNLILDVATTIVQPFGVITAHDRATRLTSNTLDPRYRCLIEVGDALRWFDPVAHVRAREGLEQLTSIDSNFAIGFTYLAAIFGREFLTGFGAREGDPPVLDRALRAARHGIELRPQSARAYHILAVVLFYRGEKDAAVAAAEKAMALNKFDLLLRFDYGGRLILSGEVDRGMRIMSEAIGAGVILPSWSHFYLFVGHYVRGQITEARFHASQLTAETYVYGQLARALIAHVDGNAAEARQAVRAILALQPGWREHPRVEIEKLVVAPELADRLAGDLVAAGYLTEPTDVGSCPAHRAGPIAGSVMRE